MPNYRIWHLLNGQSVSYEIVATDGLAARRLFYEMYLKQHLPLPIVYQVEEFQYLEGVGSRWVIVWSKV